MSGHSEHHHPPYVQIYLWLVVLTGASVLLSRFLHDFHYLMILFIFGIAAVKALLVALNFMHLRFERALIVGCALIPLLLFTLILFAFMPDLLATVKR